MGLHKNYLGKLSQLGGGLLQIHCSEGQTTEYSGSDFGYICITLGAHMEPLFLSYKSCHICLIYVIFMCAMPQIIVIQA